MKTYECPTCKSTRDEGDASTDPKDSSTPKCSKCSQDMVLKEESDATEPWIWKGLLDPQAFGDAPPLPSVGTHRTASAALEPNATSPKKSKSSTSNSPASPNRGVPRDPAMEREIHRYLAQFQLLLPIFYPSTDPRISPFRDALNLHGLLDRIPQNIFESFIAFMEIVPSAYPFFRCHLLLPALNYLLATDRDQLRHLIHLVTTYTQQFSTWVRGHPDVHIRPWEASKLQGSPQTPISDPLFTPDRSPFNDGTIPRLTVLRFAVLLEELNDQGQLVNMRLSCADAVDCLALFESPEFLTLVEPEVTEWLLSLDREATRTRLETWEGHLRDLLQWLFRHLP